MSITHKNLVFVMQLGRTYVPVVAAVAWTAFTACSVLDKQTASEPVATQGHDSGDTQDVSSATSAAAGPTTGDESPLLGDELGHDEIPGDERRLPADSAAADGMATYDEDADDDMSAPHKLGLTPPMPGGLDAISRGIVTPPGALDGGDPRVALDEADEGFCSDDVYSQHLMREHRSRRSADADHGKGKRPNADPDRDRAAIFYAKRRMIGATEPYFGSIPIVANERIEIWIHYFKTAGRAEFLKWLVRGEALRRIVQPILQDSGVPKELFYLAMVESGFSNSAYSRKRATGTWQFMPATASHYGLRINGWVDERRDPIKSTLAAAGYLRDLYARLGDWHLAMAAYNAGPSKVRKAVNRGGTRDFWRLTTTPHLARETKNYVPKVLAAVLLASDARKHGFEIKPSDDDLFPDTEVLVRRPVKMDELAAALNISLKTLNAWNPELLRGVTPPSLKGYPLRLPTALASRFPDVEPKLTQLKVVDVKLHVVRKGDTLERIARDYKVPMSQLRTMNPGVSPSRLKLNSAIAVPVPAVLVVAPQKA